VFPDQSQPPDTYFRLLGILKDDPRAYLQFPLAVGKKWNFQYSFSGFSPRGGRTTVTRNVEYEVTGIETVQIPAGKFETFAIQRIDYNASGGGNTIEYDYHYSPQTKSTIKLKWKISGLDSGQSDTELLKYTPGKAQDKFIQSLRV